MNDFISPYQAHIQQLPPPPHKWFYISLKQQLDKIDKKWTNPVRDITGALETRVVPLLCLIIAIISSDTSLLSLQQEPSVIVSSLSIEIQVPPIVIVDAQKKTAVWWVCGRAGSRWW